MDVASWEALGTWFSGILTAGSLILGFSILRRDRQREERAQAAKVSAWFEGHLFAKKVSIYVANHSEQVIRVPVLLLKAPADSDALDQQMPLEPQTVMPGQVAHYADEYLEAPLAHYKAVVTFTDTAGVAWERDMKTQELRQASRRRITSAVKRLLRLSNGH